MTAQREDKMALGLFIHTYGYASAGWLHPSVAGARATDFSHMAKIARIAEDAAMDFIFFADSAAAAIGDPVALSRQPHKMDRFEPLTLLAALSVVTSRIGLAATASTSFYEPYNIARLFQSIDHLSGGRAAWNVVTSDHNEVGYNFGQDGLPDHADRYARAQEFVDVVFGLWDTWEPDAVINDPAAARYFDETKVHVLNHVGEYFKVRGPLNIAASPQVRPIITQAGASDAGKRLAARTADVVFGAGTNIAQAQAYYSDLKSQLAEFGRATSDLKILPGLRLTVGETEKEAHDQLRWLAENTHPDVGRTMVGEFLEADLSGVPLDQPVPEELIPASPRGSKVLFEQVAEIVRSGAPLGDVIQHYVQHGLGNGVTGSVTQVVDYMEEWFHGGAADGFIMMPAVLPAGAEEIATLVIPELRRRGLFREEYEGTTLRENLGVPAPTNRFTSAGEPAR